MIYGWANGPCATDLKKGITFCAFYAPSTVRRTRPADFRAFRWPMNDAYPAWPEKKIFPQDDFLK
jgi:hypothetical protein